MNMYIYIYRSMLYNGSKEWYSPLANKNFHKRHLINLTSYIAYKGNLIV